MPKASKKAVKKRAVVKEPVKEIKPDPFKTTDMQVTDFLNKKGISPALNYGSPMVFEYDSKHTKAIQELLAEREA